MDTMSKLNEIIGKFTVTMQQNSGSSSQWEKREEHLIEPNIVSPDGFDKKVDAYHAITIYDSNSSSKIELYQVDQDTLDGGKSILKKIGRAALDIDGFEGKLYVAKYKPADKRNSEETFKDPEYFIDAVKQWIKNNS